MWGLGFAGRIGRLQWLTGVLMLLLLLTVVHVVSLEHPDPSWVHGERLAVGVALVLLLRLAALRFHDRDRTGWWCLALLVPGLNLVALFELSLLPGGEHVTRHGFAPVGGSFGELSFAAAMLGVFAGLGTLSFHPTYAIDALQSAEIRRALQPYGSLPAKHAFEEAYRPAPRPKAYAASGRGAFGWSASASTTAEAVARALQACERRRRWGERACALLDINDRDTRPDDATAPGVSGDG
jgi:uncharacterized membrane protein YhaH (DUF805 family)